MWLDIAIAISCGGGGLVCGWIMHAIGGFGNHGLVKHAVTRVRRSNGVHAGPAPERVSQVASRLSDYATSIAANVDAHQTKVQAINNLLRDENEISPEVALEAMTHLIEANQMMQAQLQKAQHQIHDQSMQIQTAEHRAQTDTLTSIPNRGAFDDHISRRHASGPTHAGTLALLGVDHFKEFNDVYGHRAGDEVLKVVANVLHARLRSFGLVARYGGEEFAIIMDHVPIQLAIGPVEAARAAIGEREIEFEGKRMHVTASAGVADLMEGESVAEWLQRAESGLYGSKQAGRDCGHWMDRNTPVRIKRTVGEPATAPLPDKSKQMPNQPLPNQPLPSQQTPSRQSTEAPEAKLATERGSDSKELGLDDSASNSEPLFKSSAFAYLPDRETLGASYAEICGRAGASIPMYLMAMRFDRSVSDNVMKSLLQIVRAAMRAVDRIGCDGDSMLLVCMPSVDETTAQERGRQILQSASALGFCEGACDESAVRIGVVQAEPGEEFADLVSRAVARCDATHEDDSAFASQSVHEATA